MPAVSIPPGLSSAFDELTRRSLPQGGFRSPRDEKPRTDATAWAAVALEIGGRGGEETTTARDVLARAQLADGRVPIDAAHPEAAWPTPLAVFAWHSSRAHGEAQRRAVEFLLASGGVPLPPDPFLGHDTTLVGWAWIGGTHSWVEPTAFCLLALELAGLGSHPRCTDARALLIDRRLPRGGWNYGNTLVFGQELRPSIDSTGIALTALRGALEPSQVDRDLAYLDSAVRSIRSPLSLAWGLLGLSTWGRRPAAAVEWLEESLGRQQRLGPYDTALLALLLLAAMADEGLLAALRTRE